MKYDDSMFSSYVNRASDPIKEFCRVNKDVIEKGRCRNHPGSQSIKPGGLKLHILQVITKALELNQSCNEQQLIETLLVHDIKGCESLPLTAAQRLAIAATKGQASYSDWRPTPHYKFVVLVLIADMWSAFINEDDR